MPFQSEKQRRYLWANEPEIARDWTDTYGSGIARALGGRIPFAEAGSTNITLPTGLNTYIGWKGIKNDYPELAKQFTNLGINTPEKIESFFTKYGDQLKQQGKKYSYRSPTIEGEQLMEDEFIPDTRRGFWESLVGGAAEGAETGSAAEDQVRQEFFDYGTQQADIGDTAYSNLKVPGLNVQHPDAPVNWSERDDLEANNYGQGIIRALPQQNKGDWLKNIADFLPFVGKKTRTGAFVRMLRNQLMPDGGITSMFNRPTTPQQQATQRFMQNYNVGRNPQTGRMVGGPFAGKNLPGTSMFGSKNPKEMAQNWLNKYGHIDHKDPKNIKKKQQITNIATMNQAPPGFVPSGHGGGTGSPGGGAQAAGDLAGGSALDSPFNRGGLAALWPR